MGLTTYTEDQIRSRHKERVSVLVDLYGSTIAIPRDVIDKLAERNKEDWIQFIAERDGKAKSEPDTPLMPAVTDEQVAAVDPVYDENGLRRIDAPQGDNDADFFPEVTVSPTAAQPDEATETTDEGTPA